jgi:uncharacterized protein
MRMGCPQQERARAVGSTDGVGRTESLMGVRAEQTWFVIGGFAAGFVAGFLGIGGGLVMVPMLLCLFRFPVKRAVGTSLVVVAAVSLAGVLSEVVVKGSNIHWGTAGALTLASLAGSRLGGQALPVLPDKFLRRLFAALLVFAAYRMLALATGVLGPSAGILADHTVLGGLAVLAVGMAAGCSSVWFGLGGGLIMVPAFSLLFGGFPFHAARATALVQILPTSVLGACQHRQMGTVDLGAARRLIPSGLAGAILGVLTVNRVPPRPCQILFAGLLVVAAGRLVWPPRSSDPAPVDGHRAEVAAVGVGSGSGD